MDFFLDFLTYTVIFIFSLMLVYVVMAAIRDKDKKAPEPEAILAPVTVPLTTESPTEFMTIVDNLTPLMPQKYPKSSYPYDSAFRLLVEYSMTYQHPRYGTAHRDFCQRTGEYTKGFGCTDKCVTTLVTPGKIVYSIFVPQSIFAKHADEAAKAALIKELKKKK